MELLTSGNLKEVESKWEACTKCTIGSCATNHVFGRGDIPAKILFIGEAPGKTEDKVGLPFVGQAGQLLDRALLIVGEFPSYYITNMVACRPCDGKDTPNRAPNYNEITSCSGRLLLTINIINPEVLVLVGKVAQNNISVLVPSLNLSKFKNVYSIYHPAYILRRGGVGSIEYQQLIESLIRIKEFVNK